MHPVEGWISVLQYSMFQLNSIFQLNHSICFVVVPCFVGSLGPTKHGAYNFVIFSTFFVNVVDLEGQNTTFTYL